MTNTRQSFHCCETDFLGRGISESRPGFGDSTLVISNLYDSAGQLVSTLSLSTRSTCSTRLNSRLYLYDNLNDRVATVSDRNFNNAIDWTGPDLISSSLTHYVKLGGDWWRETRQWSIHDDDSAAPRLMGVRRSRVTGLGSDALVASAPNTTLASETISIDQRGNATTNRVWRNRAAAEEIAWVKYPTSATPAVTTSTNGLVRSSTSQTGVTTTFAYDAFQREVSQTDGRGNTTRTVYDSLGRVTSTIDALGYATTYGYDALGRQVSVTDPLTNTVTTAYDSEGHVLSQRGATYPVDYAYDEFGDKVSMTTYRDINAAGDVTRWLRDEATGLVTNKVYADGKGPRYDYTPDGKLATRTWARGIVTTYSYDDNGSLTNTVYSDGTPTISIVYNRAGRQVRAEDAAGVTTFAYDDFGAVTNETVIGVVVTNTIERFYDCFARSLGYSLNGIRQSTLTYDPATGRLASMLAAGSDTPFTWNYLAGSDLKSSLAYPNGLTASWQYDANSQLLQVKNALPTNTISQYDYAYDAGGRRIQIVRSGSAMSENRTDVYGYNSKGELISAVKQGAVPETEYAYEYDDIGNRISSFDLGTNRTYVANNLNQYAQISNLCDSLPAIALAEAGAGGVFLPQFDDDGNQTLIQTSSGIWSVIYNGENRPVQWSNGSTNIIMSFDSMGRRVQYLEKCGATTNSNKTFTYCGYLQVSNVELSTLSFGHHTFIWDPTEPIATRPLVFNNSAEHLQFYTHDGNKNVSELTTSFDGVVSAHYEYSPCGYGVWSCGSCASVNPYRFSCENEDDVLQVVYYNYRHYSMDIGSWVSRDPIGEWGLGLYKFDGNVVLGFDYLGNFRLTLISNETTDSDALVWYLSRLQPGGVTPGGIVADPSHDIVSNLSSVDSMIAEMEKHVAVRRELITQLDLSGHGVSSKVGVLFKNGSFDIESLTQEQKKRLKACLSPLARITFWSCSSASTLKQQSALQMFANEMQLRIEAKDGLVSSGPDGTTLEKIVRKVVYLLKGMDEDKEWKIFVPVIKREKCECKGPKAVIIKNTEVAP